MAGHRRSNTKLEKNVRFEIKQILCRSLAYLLPVVAVCGFLASSAQACKLGSMGNRSITSAIKAPSTALPDQSRLPAHEPTPVGLWLEEFQGADGSDDKGFDTFYADGNELLIDNSAPATDNVCSGVWEQTGPLTFKVNHPSWDFDPSGNLMAVVVLTATITIDRNGNSFKGRETVVVYDPTLTSVIYQMAGTLTGKRITVNSNPL